WRRGGGRSWRPRPRGGDGGAPARRGGSRTRRRPAATAASAPRRGEREGDASEGPLSSETSGNCSGKRTARAPGAHPRDGAPGHLPVRSVPKMAERQFIPMSVAVLTVSDTRTFETDTSGALAAQALQSAGHRVVERRIVRDDVAVIRGELERWMADPGVSVVVITGGTGITMRDV